MKEKNIGVQYKRHLTQGHPTEKLNKMVYGILTKWENDVIIFNEPRLEIELLQIIWDN